jgi:hypothetical protein
MLALAPKAKLGRIVRLALGTVALGVLAACGAGPLEDDDPELGESESALAPLDPEVDDEVTRTPWQPIGFGVTYKPFGEQPARPNVLLVYGGYTAQDEWVQRWANELLRVKGEALGIGHLYAIKGPNQAGYANREIQNSKLAAHLALEGRAANATSLVTIAHSSGTYVADELLRMLRDGTGGIPQDTVGKVDLFNLDGGGVSNPTLLRQLSSAYFVLACDRAIGRCSHNASGMRSLGAQYASLGGAFEVNATGSGCSRTASGGLWCLHDTVINTRPHNPAMYDLKRDYTVFTGGRALVTSYLDPLTELSPQARRQPEGQRTETADYGR